ncbi:uncharacterized protein LOC124826428 [Vigna umbellata]|uniref:uncharacterized protein LOC124826428 n=1 Tax=Vigna umbellata TaxID=87088 RepID=UPI001F5E81B5|nr:uncharacterized protein LOC124826428 [Vigna umbellata]
MGPKAFINLCERLRTTGIVKEAIRSTVEEQVAQFLHIIGHNVKNRSVAFFFHRSGSTVSKHFHNVLDGILTLESEFLIQPSGNEVHPYVFNNNRFYAYFKDYLGAIDGTHFDVKFTYILAGWEGTTSDSRILKNALDRDDPLVIPQGECVYFDVQDFIN